MTVAPCSSAYLIVGRDARIRVSSPIVPCLIGTLKSTRMKTRFPSRSRSLTPRGNLQPLLDEIAQQVHAAVRVAPLVVVPGKDLDEVAVHHFRVGRIDDRRVLVSLEVDRDE